MLAVSHVSSGYPGLPVLFDVSVEVGAGELVSVLGGNGAGKSTLLKTILGDVRTSAGEITFDGRRLTGAPLHRRTAAGISYCPEGRRVFPTLTVEENLVAGSSGIPTGELAARIAAVHELFPRLAERREQPAGSLSGGEQQMLAIGRALVPAPRLLMVEELSLGLAPVVVSGLYAALRSLCEQGLAVIVAEQFQRFEAKWSDRWVVLERGTVAARGSGKGAVRAGQGRAAMVGTNGVAPPVPEASRPCAGADRPRPQGARPGLVPRLEAHPDLPPDQR